MNCASVCVVCIGRETQHMCTHETLHELLVCLGVGVGCVCVGSVCVLYFGWRELQNRCHKMLGLALF